MIKKSIKFDTNKYKKTELENGLRVISEYIPNVESFALGISINAGSRRDPQGLSGLAHFFEHICFRDTENRSSKQIAFQFESIGANTNAFTTKEMICFYARALKQHFNNTLDILSDLILYPKFNIKDIEKERNIIFEEIKSIEDDPEELIFDITDNILFEYKKEQISIIHTTVNGNKKSTKLVNPEDKYSFEF